MEGRKTLMLLAMFVLTSGLFSAKKFDASKFNPMHRYPLLKSKTQEKVCLNGVWKFMPLFDKKPYSYGTFPDPKTPPAQGKWHDILVPGMFKERAPGWSGVKLPDGKPIPEEWMKINRGWYQRTYKVPEDWKSKAVFLKFDGIAFYGKIYVNNQPVGFTKAPGRPYTVNVTDKIKFGQDNKIDVYVIDANAVCIPPSQDANLKGLSFAAQSAWTILPEIWDFRRNVSGIWQDVYIEAKPKIFIEDIFAMPSFRKKEIAGQVLIKNLTEDPQVCRLELDILDDKGEKVLTIGRVDLAILKDSSEKETFSNSWKELKLWDIDEPNMYYMRARLIKYGAKETIIDEKIIRFGFREVWVDKENIYLNGRILHVLGDWDCNTNACAPLGYHRYEYSFYKFRHFLKDLGLVAPRVVGLTAYSAVFDAADDAGCPIIWTGYAGTNIDENSYNDLAAEWQDHIKKARNHPSIILWSVQNESMMHEKNNRLYMLQRKLDQVLTETDPTRPYYHDGHCRLVEGDPGAKYENGDLCGTAPISGGHYTSAVTPMSSWLHEFDDWRKKKPFMYGEAGTFEYPHIISYARMYYGEDFFGKNKDEIDEIAADTLKLIVGSWRSYGVTMINPHGTYQYPPTCYDSVSPLRLTFPEWNDLTTPGPKISSTDFMRYNPYEPEQKPTGKLSKYGQRLKKTFTPVRVTLQRDLRHSFFSGQKISKETWIVNDTKKDLKATLFWSLEKADGKVKILEKKDQVMVKQGIPLQVKCEIKLPEVSKAEKLILTAEVKDRTGEYNDKDTQLISVYPQVQSPKLTKKFYLYDKDGKLKELLDKLNLKYTDFNEDMFKGDPGNEVLLIAPYSSDKNLKQFNTKIDNFIKNGGCVLVFNQKCELPSTAASNAALQSENHPIFDGLAEKQIYFWNGKDNLVAECKLSLPEDKGCLTGHVYMPPPHVITWPKNDLLFEMMMGKGVLIGCNLLLVDRYTVEPEAQIIFNNLLKYVNNFKRNILPLYYFGDDKVLKKLNGIGLEPEKVVTYKLNGLKTGTMIIASAKDLAKNKNAIMTFINKGGNVVLLQQNKDTWDPAVFEGDLELSPTNIKKNQHLRGHYYKTNHEPLFNGMGSILSDSIDKANAINILKPQIWGKNYQVVGADEKKNLYGMVWKEIGKGKLIWDQIPYESGGKGRQRLDDSKKLLLCMLNNLGADLKQPEPFEYMGVFNMIKETFADVRPITPEERKKFSFVNLKHQMNAVFGGSKFNRDVTMIKYAKVPLGEWAYADIPFYLVDPDKDELMGGDPGAPNSCIVLRGSRQPVHPPRIDGIKIGEKAKKIHFLHASCWGITLKDANINPDYDVVTYKFHYEDGATVEFTAKNNVHIRDYWIRYRHFTENILKKGKLAWGERFFDMPYALAMILQTTWENPHPDKTIESMDIISKDTAVPVVYAVTLEK